MKWLADPSLRIDRDQRMVTGGVPLRLFRLTGRGLDLVDAILDGRDTDGAGTGERALVTRLADAGLIHPSPDAGASGFDATDVTAVIPVRDDLARLVRLLGVLAETTPDLGGVVVVDDGSRVPVREAVTGHSLPFEIRVVRCAEPRGPGAARNRGLAHVTTALVAFVDSDCVPTPGWLGPIVDQFFDDRVAVVAPRVVARSDVGTNVHIARYEADRSPLDLGDEPALVRPLCRVSYVPSAAQLARTASMREVSGFDETMRVGEDVDAIWRIIAAGHHVRYEPRSIVQHDTRSTPTRWLGQRFSYGRSAAPLAARHGDHVAPAVLSRSSLAIWFLTAVGHRRVAASVAAVTTLFARRRLEAWPTVDAVKMVLTGHLIAGRQLAGTMVRVWWPVALVTALCSRRARKVVAGALAVTIMEKRPHDPAQVALGLVDDLAYGAGVWAGCARERSVRALLPGLT